MINVTHKDILTRPTHALTGAISFLVTPDHCGVHTLQRTRDKALLARIDYAASLIAESIDAGSLRLSPGRFATTGGFIPNRAIEQLLTRSSRLSNFRAEVMAAGVYDQVTAGLITKNVGIYTGRMDRLVSSLVAASDLSAFSALDTSDVLAWLTYHYDAALRTFANQTLWGPGANLSGKCIRTFAGVIGDKFEHFQIQQMTLIRRTAQPGYKHGRMKENPPVEFAEWMDHWKAWRGTVPPTTDGGWLGCNFLIDYLTALKKEEVAVSDPYQFLLAPRPFSLLQHLVKCHTDGRSIRSIIQGAGFLAKFSEFLVERLDLNAKSVSYIPLFTRSDERQVKGLHDDSTKLAPLGKVAANPMPPRLGNVYRQMLLEGPNGWPATHHLCQHPDGSYNPTMPTLFILADELASRVAQIVRLDSGEGDLEIFDAHKMDWVDNTGPCAGYWKRETPKEPNRGFARRSDDHQITGIFLNTNKSSPNHFVPWQNVFALTLLYDLFLYQREHNPISGPVTAAAYLAAVQKADDKKILTYPSIFPLFRMPPVKRQRVSSPVTV